FLNPRQIIYLDGPRTRRLDKARSVLASGIYKVKRHLAAGAYEVVIGEYRSAFAWALLRKLGVSVRSIVVVDDGTATLRMDRRRRIPRSREGWRLALQRTLLRLVGIRCAVPPAGLIFFTAYAIDDYIAEGDTLVRNDYRSLRDSICGLTPDEDSVYVLGGDVTGPHDAGGVDVYNHELELALELGRFAAADTGKAVIYVAHRREQVEKLDALRKEFTVVTPSVPFEIFPRIIGKRPRAIIAYCSSALVTAAELFGDSVDLTALQLPRAAIQESSRRFIDGIYDYYQREVPAIRIVQTQRPNSQRLPDSRR
ncbi:MAG: hypothetical protein ACKOI2_10845, partial [Actinomycetota bacterium]